MTLEEVARMLAVLKARLDKALEQPDLMGGVPAQGKWARIR